MKSAAMARSAWRTYMREWANACDESLSVEMAPDECGFIPWPLVEHVGPVEQRWASVRRWVKRETGGARGRFWGRY